MGDPQGAWEGITGVLIKHHIGASLRDIQMRMSAVLSSTLGHCGTTRRSSSRRRRRCKYIIVPS